MSPYAFKITALVGGWASMSTVISIYTVYKEQQPLLPFLLIGVTVFMLFAYVFLYYSQISEIDKLVGIYVRARNFKRVDDFLVRAFRLHPYFQYYGKRPEDGEIRTKLKDNGGVVILGKPYSGKTRAALEAIWETHPRAFVLSFLSPNGMTPEAIRDIVLPSFFIFFRKPKVVLFIDDAQKYSGSPFAELFARLHNQCSQFYIVATVRTGFNARLGEDAELRHALSGIARVELGPLSAQTAYEIRSNVWKEGSGPLTDDISLPGLIMSGPREMRERYDDLPAKLRRIITALRLAAACGAIVCERSFLLDILREVLSQDIVEVESMIVDLEKRYILRVDGKDNVSVQHDEYFQSDYRDFYSTHLFFKKDLKKVQALLVAGSNSSRLLQLGLYYWNSLQDFGAARSALEASMRCGPSALGYASLARLYLCLGEPEIARSAINSAVETTKDLNIKAVIITVFAYEILFKMGDGATALGWYTVAMQHATDPLTSGEILVRQADCHVRLKRFSEAEPIYRSYLTNSPLTEKNHATARLFLSIVAQDRASEAQELLRQAWSAMPEDGRLALTLSVLENAEGFFPDMASYRDGASNAVWREYRDRALKLLGRERVCEALVMFGDSCLSGGFLTPAVTCYGFIIDRASELQVERHSLVGTMINLGAALRDRQMLSEARKTFSLAKALAQQDSAMKGLAGSAIAGLADCDLLEEHPVSLAEAQYHEAMRLGKESGNEVTVGWVQMGLGDIDIINRDFVNAKKNHGAPWLIPKSVSGQSRISLGLARACFGLSEFDDAELYVGSGIALTLRIDYRFRQKQFLKLKERLAMVRKAELATSGESDLD